MAHMVLWMIPGNTENCMLSLGKGQECGEGERKNTVLPSHASTAWYDFVAVPQGSTCVTQWSYGQFLLMLRLNEGKALHLQWHTA